MPLNVSVKNLAIDKEFCFVLVCQKRHDSPCITFFLLSLSPICSQWASLPSPDWDLPLLINERYFPLLEEDSRYMFSSHDVIELNAKCQLFLEFEFRCNLILKYISTCMLRTLITLLITRTNFYTIQKIKIHSNLILKDYPQFIYFIFIHIRRMTSLINIFFFCIS